MTGWSARDAEGTTVRDLLSPLETLAVLVLAFVLVAASESFGEAEDSARLEAKMVDHLFEVAEYAPVAARERIQADAVCYARAVRSLEWLVEADKERSSGRQERLTESTPAIPDVVYWFMLITLMILVAAFAFSLPRRRNRAEIVTLTVLTALLTVSLLLIRDVDRPFAGLITVSSEPMSLAADDITEDFVKVYGEERIPCDDDGRKVRRIGDDARHGVCHARRGVTRPGGCPCAGGGLAARSSSPCGPLET